MAGDVAQGPDGPVRNGHVRAPFGDPRTDGDVDVERHVAAVHQLVLHQEPRDQARVELRSVRAEPQRAAHALEGRGRRRTEPLEEHTVDRDVPVVDAYAIGARACGVARARSANVDPPERRPREEIDVGFRVEVGYLVALLMDGDVWRQCPAADDDVELRHADPIPGDRLRA